MKLKYANENKSKDEAGWILDFNFLIGIQEKIEDKRYNIDLEDIELVLLTVNDEEYLLNQV